MRLRLIFVVVVAAALAAGAMAPRLARALIPATPAYERIEYLRRVDQFRALPAAPVVMVGDSLTGEGEWRELLGPQVANRGIGHDTTTGLLRRLDTVPASARTVFLMIGVNDLAGEIPVKTVADNTRRIVGLLPGEVHLQSVLHTDDPDMNRRIDDLNRLNRSFCRAGACIYVDLNGPLEAVRPSPRIDGLHLRGEAYIRWAAVIAPQLPAS